MNKYIEPKIIRYFDQLELNIEEQDFEQASLTLAKLSVYSHIFDDEHSDYYEYANYLVEQYYDDLTDLIAEPTEMDEWASYDPDC